MARYEPRCGDLLVHENGERVLVGDVNELGGVCDDCCSAPWTRHSAPIPPADEHGRSLWDSWQELDPGWRLDRNLMDGAK